jgi:Cyclin
LTCTHACSRCVGSSSLQGNAALQPDPLNVHRLLLTGVLLAAKLMDDRYYSNAYYAKVRMWFACCASHIW